MAKKKKAQVKVVAEKPSFPDLSSEFRALIGLNFIDSSGEECRVSAGDKITDIPENVLSSEWKAGNIEVWVSGQTENVRDHDPGPLNRVGVLVEREGGKMIMKGVNDK